MVIKIVASILVLLIARKAYQIIRAVCYEARTQPGPVCYDGEPPAYYDNGWQLWLDIIWTQWVCGEDWTELQISNGLLIYSIVLAVVFVPLIIWTILK